MKSMVLVMTAALVLATRSTVGEEDAPSVATLPPVVVETHPRAGATDVPVDLKEIRVTFSKPMKDHSWSWSTVWKDSGAELDGKPSYADDGRTCVLPVKLEPGRCYGYWLNSQKFGNFQDADGRKAVPYLLSFETAAE